MPIAPATLRRVEVSVARRSGRLCRAVGRGGRLGRRAGCNAGRWLSAEGVGTWFPQVRRRLPSGAYVIGVRVVGRDGRASAIQARRRVVRP